MILQQNFILFFSLLNWWGRIVRNAQNSIQLSKALNFIEYWFFIILNAKAMNTPFIICIYYSCNFVDNLKLLEVRISLTLIMDHICWVRVETISPIHLQILSLSRVDTILKRIRRFLFCRLIDLKSLISLRIKRQQLQIEVLEGSTLKLLPLYT